jgi:polysaccharide deacetylase family protein (PEP-CTERM system associated)
MQHGKSIFSVDVEDWFHILDVPSTPALSSWDTLPSYVEKNFYRLLDLFAAHDVKVTCFFLGWIGERFPHLVKRALADGHEIASHGYSHRLVYEMGRTEFFRDSVHARKLLEDISGEAVLGYRSAGFSVRADTAWFFEVLCEAGYEYDSSVFPAERGHGGISEYRREPHQIVRHGMSLVEFPITVADLLGKRLCFFGGGYLRLFPYGLIRRMGAQVLGEGRPVVFYIHPREIDPHHPRLPMSAARRFKSYVNLASTEGKLKAICRDFPLITFRDYLAMHMRSLAAHVH